MEPTSPEQSVPKWAVCWTSHGLSIVHITPNRRDRWNEPTRHWRSDWRRCTKKGVHGWMRCPSPCAAWELHITKMLGCPPTRLCLADASGECFLMNYCIQFSETLQETSNQVIEAWAEPPEGGHSLVPDQWIMIHKPQRLALEAKYEGPYQILLVTPSAVRVAKKSKWIHASHCKLVDAPTWREDLLFSFLCFHGWVSVQKMPGFWEFNLGFFLTQLLSFRTFRHFYIFEQRFAHTFITQVYWETLITDYWYNHFRIKRFLLWWFSFLVCFLNH